MKKTRIRLGHSPDPDDAFMFFGIICGAVDTGPYEFEPVLRDIQTLNDWAQHGRLEVTAMSMHAYAFVRERYAMLSSGASMAALRLVDGATRQERALAGTAQPEPTPFAAPPSCCRIPDGPILVSSEPMDLYDVVEKTIAIPGTMTTAFLALQLAIGKKVDYLVMMFNEIQNAVRDGKAQVGLIIHEGQLTYHHHGLHCLMDLGQWWYNETHLPLPMGCNVIRRDLGEQAMREIGDILKASIQYGLEHPDQALEYARQFAHELDDARTLELVKMYVNDWTLDYGPIGKKAVNELFQRAHRAGLIPSVDSVDYV